MFDSRNVPSGVSTDFLIASACMRRQREGGKWENFIWNNGEYHAVNGGWLCQRDFSRFVPASTLLPLDGGNSEEHNNKRKVNSKNGAGGNAACNEAQRGRRGSKQPDANGLRICVASTAQPKGFVKTPRSLPSIQLSLLQHSCHESHESLITTEPVQDQG